MALESCPASGLNTGNPQLVSDVTRNILLGTFIKLRQIDISFTNKLLSNERLLQYFIKRGELHRSVLIFNKELYGIKVLLYFQNPDPVAECHRVWVGV